MIEYLALQKISIENNKINNGNLSFTFFEMLNLLTFKHQLSPLVLVKYNEDQCIGYCIYYFYQDAIQISQICISKKYQNQGIGEYFLNELLKFQKTITADIAMDNLQSQCFFTKNNFILMQDENKHRFRAIREK